MIYNYKPSRYILNRVRQFAQDRMSGSSRLYSYRGEKNMSKMEEDIIIGTLGEYAVYNYLKSKGYKCSRPDLKIYEKKRKSFDADLKVSSMGFKPYVRHVHVKSQSLNSVKRYGQSWLFQKSDSLVANPEKSDIMIFTNVCPTTWEVNIVGIVHPRLVTELGLWGECKVWSYRKTKVAIYLEDLEPYGIVRKRFSLYKE